MCHLRRAVSSSSSLGYLTILYISTPCQRAQSKDGSDSFQDGGHQGTLHSTGYTESLSGLTHQGQGPQQGRRPGTSRQHWRSRQRKRTCKSCRRNRTPAHTATIPFQTCPSHHAMLVTASTQRLVGSTPDALTAKHGQGNKSCRYPAESRR